MKKTRIIIDIETNLKGIKWKDVGFDDDIEGNDDCSKEVEERFHDAIWEWIEKKITEYNEDEFEPEVMEIFNEKIETPNEKITEISKLGDTRISLSQKEDDVP